MNESEEIKRRISLLWKLEDILKGIGIISQRVVYNPQTKNLEIFIHNWAYSKNVPKSFEGCVVDIFYTPKNKDFYISEARMKKGQ